MRNFDKINDKGIYIAQYLRQRRLRALGLYIQKYRGRPCQGSNLDRRRASPPLWPAPSDLQGANTNLGSERVNKSSIIDNNDNRGKLFWTWSPMQTHQSVKHACLKGFPECSRMWWGVLPRSQSNTESADSYSCWIRQINYRENA
jgi:hypothetical protein